MSFRRIAVLLFAALWASTPLLACLPNSTMTPAEMECCKKMAGNCDMGGGNHKCCDTTLNRSAPTTAVVHSYATHGLGLPVVIARAGIELPQLQFADNPRFTSVAITSSPPGFSTVLRN